MTASGAPATQTTYAAFWLYRARANRFQLSPDAKSDLAKTVVRVFACHEQTVRLRAVYSTTGLSAGVDLIFWLLTGDLAHLQCLATDLHRSPMAATFDLKHAYLGAASSSQYDPSHGPAFLRDVPPKRYLSVYPFTKTPAWYLVPFEERRALMKEHGDMGHEFPTIMTNTVSSFGVADQEFVVALEDDDPGVLIKMVQRLRSAAVRKYTQVDTPIFLGLRKDVEPAVLDAL